MKNDDIKVLMWLPQIGAAVVQGVTAQYLVFYALKTCSCPDHQMRHRECKHIRYVMEELASREK
jgi:hypothetical protein